MAGFEPFEIVSLLSDSADLADVGAFTPVERDLAARIKDISGNVERYLGLGPQGIFWAATGVFVAMQATWLLNGYEKPVHPNTGGEFHQGQHTFSTDIAETLQNAAATQWSGEAATNYDNINTRQKNHVKTLAEADQKVTRILAEQADTVQKADRELTIIEAFFVPLLTVEAGLLVISWMPGMRAHAYALMVLVLVMMVSLYAAAFVIVLSVHGGGKKTQRDLRAVIDDYQSVANGPITWFASSAAPTVAVPGAPGVSTIVGKRSATLDKSDAAGVLSNVLDEHVAQAARVKQLFVAGQAAGVPGHVAQYANLGAHSAKPAKQPPAQASPAPAADEESPQAVPAAALAEQEQAGAVSAPTTLVTAST